MIFASVAVCLPVAGADAPGAVPSPQADPSGPTAPSGSGRPAEAAADGAAAENPAPPPSDRVLEEGGATIGNVIVRVGNIFDPEKPGENRFVFRVANRLHIKTHEKVIRSRLLFKPGDAYSRRLLEESERLLRDLTFVYDAKIRPVRFEDNRVDVEVVTRDVWTLHAGFNFGRKGGANSSSFGIQDENILGTGKNVSVERSSNVDRTSFIYEYRDPAVLGSRMQMVLAYSDNSDGRERRFGLERPFYSLDSRWSAGVYLDAYERIDPLYTLGAVSSQFQHQHGYGEVYMGFSPGLENGRAHRFKVGYTFARDTFGAPAGSANLPATAPSDRTLAYPWFCFESVEDGFITATDLDKIARTEDINLAQEYRVLVGWASPSFGADRSRLLWEGSYGIGTNPGHGQLLFVSGQAAGRAAGSRPENVTVGAGVRYYLREQGGNVFYAAARADAAHDLDGETQLLMGGDSGLRGYPLRYQQGDRRLLFTMEQRFYTSWDVLKLFHLGAAVFFDAGRAWFAGRGEPTDLGVIKDVGAGLRIESSRSARAKMIHVDVAYPLDAATGARRFQISVTTGETF